MIQQLLKRFIYGRIYCSIAHQPDNDGNAQTNILYLKQQKGTFAPIPKATYDDADKKLSGLKKKQHFFLVVNDEQVLSKTVTANDIKHPEKIVTTAFPNLNIKDFYFEIYRSEKKCFIAICRKDHIDKLIADYSSKQHDIIAISLGVLSFAHLLPFIKTTAKMRLPNASIEIDHNEIQEITPQNEPCESVYTINGLHIAPGDILPLAGIIAYFTEQQKTTHNFSSLLVSLKERQLHNKLFSALLKGGLTFFFVVLLINFLCFSYFDKKVTELRSDLQHTQSLTQEVQRLTTAVAQKKKTLSKLTTRQRSKASYYLDCLGASVPKTVLLNHLNYQPITKKISPKKKLSISKGVITLKGETTDGAIFSEWVLTLENEPWVKKVHTTSYIETEHKTHTFELRIHYKYIL